MGFLHPCQECGACCATFRVSFYWGEPVPEAFTERLNHFQSCMKGTKTLPKPRCIALQGTIGSEVSCSIYENRPTPCRSFEASFEGGEINERCDQARIQKGLSPLTKADWIAFRARASDLKPEG